MRTPPMIKGQFISYPRSWSRQFFGDIAGSSQGGPASLNGSGSPEAVMIVFAFWCVGPTRSR
jgi:hypothetical protein